MENYLNQNFHAVKAKHSSEEVLQKWRGLCHIVKNPKRRFRHTANIVKRNEAAAMRRTNQVINCYIIPLVLLIMIHNHKFSIDHRILHVPF